MNTKTKENVCPICGCKDLDYETQPAPLSNEYSILYFDYDEEAKAHRVFSNFTCSNCGIKGVEWYKMTFEEQCIYMTNEDEDIIQICDYRGKEHSAWVDEQVAKIRKEKGL